jgi:hypothetical protein
VPAQALRQDQRWRFGGTAESVFTSRRMFRDWAIHHPNCSVVFRTLLVRDAKTLE